MPNFSTVFKICLKSFNTPSFAASGKLVLCALDPTWDCGPTEFLSSPHILGTPNRLLSEARSGNLFNRMLSQPPAWAGLKMTDWLNALFAISTADAMSFGIPSPTISSSVAALIKTSHNLGASRPRAITGLLGREALRQRVFNRGNRDESI